MAACLFNTTMSVNPCGERLLPLIRLSWCLSGELGQVTWSKTSKAKTSVPISVPLYVWLLVFLSSGKTHLYSSLCAGMYVVQFMDVHSMWDISWGHCRFDYLVAFADIVCAHICIYTVIALCAYAWWWMGAFICNTMYAVLRIKGWTEKEMAAMSVCDSWDGQLNRDTLQRSSLGQTEGLGLVNYWSNICCCASVSNVSLSFPAPHINTNKATKIWGNLSK